MLTICCLLIFGGGETCTCRAKRYIGTYNSYGIYRQSPISLWSVWYMHVPMVCSDQSHSLGTLQVKIVTMPACSTRRYIRLITLNVLHVPDLVSSPPLFPCMFYATKISNYNFASQFNHYSAHFDLDQSSFYNLDKDDHVKCEVLHKAKA